MTKIDLRKCADCRARDFETYGNMDEHPCVECARLERFPGPVCEDCQGSGGRWLYLKEVACPTCLGKGHHAPPFKAPGLTRDDNGKGYRKGEH